MTKIENIWRELEDEKATQGILLRRYSGKVLPDIFIALLYPEKFRCIAVIVNSNCIKEYSQVTNLHDISIEFFPYEKELKKSILVIKLLNNFHTDIFSVLCEDLILCVANLVEERLLLKELYNRFEKWKSLFNKAASDSLTSEEQRGLYGELYLLKKMLLNSCNYKMVIDSWVGCENQVRDFQISTWGIEVKTTHGNNHQKIHISSERQLDISSLKYLYLFHLSLDILQNSIETLNQIIDSILSILKNDYITMNRFRNKLIAAGYFNHQKNLYDSIGYFVRQEIFYRIQNDFPRIEEKDIRKGVGDVKYTIIVSQCSDNVILEKEIMQLLEGL